jgi:hypothetical protein
MAVVEYRARRDGKLIVATLAVKQLLGRGEFHGWHLAARTFDTVRPAEPNKQFPATFVSVKMLHQIN